MHSHSELAWFRLSPADERASPADGNMSMRQWVGYAVIGHWHGHGVRSSWVWACVLWAGWLWARACVGHGASVGVVGVPWLWQGEGANGVPIQRNLLNVYPNLELTRYKRHSLIWNYKEPKGVPSPTSDSPITSIDFIKRDFPKNNKK